MIQYAAGAILAEKTGLSLGTNPQFRNDNFGEAFSLQTIDGVCHNETIELTDENYFDHHYNPEPNTGYLLNGFLQDGRLLCDHRDFILDLYKCDIQRDSIHEYDCFVHARIGDLLNNPNRNMAYFQPDYLEQQLETARNTFNTVYISSDTIDYPPLVELINKYDLTIYQSDPLETILFAKNFNNLILSAGSFSYWMAYLSSAENITVYHNNKQDPLQKQNAWDYNKNVKFIK